MVQFLGEIWITESPGLNDLLGAKKIDSVLFPYTPESAKSTGVAIEANFSGSVSLGKEWMECLYCG